MEEENKKEEKIQEVSEENSLDDNDSNIKLLVKKNIALTEEVLGLVKKLDNYRRWQQVFGVLKILIILVPIVIGIMYLPAILEKAMGPYLELLGLSDSMKDVNLKGLAPDILKSLK